LSPDNRTAVSPDHSFERYGGTIGVYRRGNFLLVLATLSEHVVLHELVVEALELQPTPEELTI
jgi:hypothetical protein